jgi:hypothetical protein
MAQNRTFQFIGNGYGDTHVSVTVTVAGTQVFSGEIPTLNVPWDPPNPPWDPTTQVVLFELADSAALNTDFSGSLNTTVVASGGYGANFQLINSNYYQGNVEIDPGAGTVGKFSQCYMGTPPNSEGSGDVRSSVVINNVPQTPTRPPDGCYPWFCPAGETMTYNWNISLGQVGNVVGNVATYSGTFTPTP